MSKHIEDIAIDRSWSYKRKYLLSRIRYWWKYKLFPHYYERRLNKAVEQFNG